MVKKTFVSSLQWTKPHNEQQPPGDSKPVIQKSKARVVVKMLDLEELIARAAVGMLMPLKIFIAGTASLQFVGGIGSNDRAEELQGP